VGSNPAAPTTIITAFTGLPGVGVSERARRRRLRWGATLSAALNDGHRMAVIGRVDEISRGVITGWAADSDPPGRPADVAILVDGLERTRLTPSLYRPGLKELCPGSTGRFGFQYRFNPPLAAFRDIHVSVRFVANGQTLNRGERLLSKVRAHSALPSPDSKIPVLVNGAGRSGSTLLMSRLSLNPEIVVARRHPYEIKLVSYYSAALGVLSATADRENSCDPDTMVNDHLHIGYNPYNRPAFFSIARDHRLLQEFFEIEAPGMTGAVFRDVILRYYETLATDSGRPQAGFFAEKISLDEVVRLGARALFGQIREIVLVRDPRDLLCSAKTFWRRTEEGAVKLVAKATQIILDIRAEAAQDVLIIRYEDLILKGGQILDEISAFIGVGQPIRQDSDVEAGMFKIHATSRTPQDSIQRWKSELGRDEVVRCESEFRNFMQVFGYDPTTGC
jgi:hypothetical protein